jgi:uncharacterized protein (DUF2267 family)
MNARGLKIVDEAVQLTNQWLNELDSRVGWEDRNRAYRLLRAVLHEVRDHLNPDEAAQLGAQLPVLVRGIYYEGWNPSKTPVRERSREGFVARVQKAFQADPMGDAEAAIRAVFWLLDRHVSEGEMEDVRRTFNLKVRALFD